VESSSSLSSKGFFFDPLLVAMDGFTGDDLFSSFVSLFSESTSLLFGLFFPYGATCEIAEEAPVVLLSKVVTLLSLLRLYTLDVARRAETLSLNSAIRRRRSSVDLETMVLILYARSVVLESF